MKNVATSVCNSKNHKSASSLPKTTIIFGYFKDGETELIEVKRLAKGHTAKARI